MRTVGRAAGIGAAAGLLLLTALVLIVGGSDGARQPAAEPESLQRIARKNEAAAAHAAAAMEARAEAHSADADRADR